MITLNLLFDSTVILVFWAFSHFRNDQIWNQLETGTSRNDARLQSNCPPHTVGVDLSPESLATHSCSGIAIIVYGAPQTGENIRYSTGKSTEKTLKHTVAGYTCV